VLPKSLHDIVIELTENELLGDAPELAAGIADVRRRGGRIAIDDAGAGYAGLKHVMRLEPDLIKLDRSLVAGVEHDASMCGFCTPGFVTTISAYLKKNPNPSLAEVREACKGNFCRCGTYPRVFEAALAAAKGSKSEPSAAAPVNR